MITELDERQVFGRSFTCHICHTDFDSAAELRLHLQLGHLK